MLDLQNIFENLFNLWNQNWVTLCMLFHKEKQIVAIL